MSLRGSRCPVWVSEESLLAAATHFKQTYPYEGVGFLTDTGFIPVENTSANPRTEFQVKTEEWLLHGEVKAVLHSHVKLPIETERGTLYDHPSATPSRADMISQKASAVPWGIMVTDEEHTGEVVWFGDQLEMAPLFRRQFVHGVTDCYSLIRDMYRLGKEGLIAAEDVNERIYRWPFDSIILPQNPRDDQWWAQGGDLYQENFASAGFTKLPIDRTTLHLLQIGDLFFYKLGATTVVNHAGVFIGQGMILHHVPGYASTTAPISLYGHGAECWLRYTKDQTPKNTGDI